MELVVSASTGAMKTLLPKLAEMLTDQYNLHKSVREDIESLQKELEGMHGALEKVSMVPADHLDSQVKIWANEVRELSYDIEDAVDSFMVRVDDGSDEPKKSHGFKKFIKKIRALFPTAKAQYDIGAMIQKIKKEVREVGERRYRYMLPGASTNTVVMDVRTPARRTTHTKNTEDTMSLVL
ncbi:disease resistance protein PIK6-NP-like [Oryza brachyantha]|uniref:Disease resistance N-terminal domain-containing protein n=1 Tax=Oryza brachyantha TaxID=4533 RepID=J3L8H9_ORYBR|nr:disease resistance protein PIK6-NP-like [Oryza brachyantha]